MGNILAIDLGKNNSAVCIFDRSSLKSKFKTIRTRKQVMHDLFVEYQGVWCKNSYLRPFLHVKAAKKIKQLSDNSLIARQGSLFF